MFWRDKFPKLLKIFIIALTEAMVARALKISLEVSQQFYYSQISTGEMETRSEMFDVFVDLFLKFMPKGEMFHFWNLDSYLFLEFRPTLRFLILMRFLHAVL